MTDAPDIKGINVKLPSNDINSISGALAGLGIAGYVLAVAINGNMIKLGQYLVQEEPYVEFVVAILIIWALEKWGPSNGITTLLVSGVVVGLILRLGSRVNINALATEFAAGKISMLQFVEQTLQQMSSNGVNNINTFNLGGA